MNFSTWEVVIQQMVVEFHETQETGQSVVVRSWRKNLEQAPHSLQQFQIDNIMREVQKRIKILAIKANPPNSTT